MDAAESKGFVHHGTPVVCKPSFKVLYGLVAAWHYAFVTHGPSHHIVLGHVYRQLSWH